MPSIPPRPRLVATILASVGALAANRWPLLAVALIVVAGLMARAGLLGVFLKFLITVIIPTSFMLILAWGVIIRAAPGEVMGTDLHGGLEYSSMISLRLAVLGAVIQLGMLSVPPRLLPRTLRSWGIRGEGMVLALGVFAVGPELILRAEQISTARKARGLGSSGPFGQLREITRMLRPLFVWSIRSAVHRADVWHQRALLLKVDQLPHADADFSSGGGAAALALSVVWFVLAIWTRTA